MYIDSTWHFKKKVTLKTTPESTQTLTYFAFRHLQIMLKIKTKKQDVGSTVVLHVRKSTNLNNNHPRLLM